MTGKTATEVKNAVDGGLAIRDVMVAEVARRIAKRESGQHYVGYESSHREAAEEYVSVILSLLPRPISEEALDQAKRSLAAFLG